MNTKKLLSAALILTASSTLFAQTATVKAEQFSSFGTNWVELDLGTTIYTVEAEGMASMDEAGFSLEIKNNYAIVKPDDKDGIFGLDAEISFAYDSLDTTENSVHIDANVYDFALELKPYLKLLDVDGLAIKGFINPFISYTYTDVQLDAGKYFRASMYEEAMCYGVKTGFEIAFLEDFYIAPAYRYLRVEPTGVSAHGEDIHMAELEIGYRLTESLSFHFSYSYVFEGDAPAYTDICMDKLMFGVRYGF